MLPVHNTVIYKKMSLFYKSDEDDAPIKRCPKCKVYIERDEGCAQMMCKNCKHAFCWYCLGSLDCALALAIPWLLSRCYPVTMLYVAARVLSNL
ncbi:UNVERIFIED_CONTAM: hypothetical protein FKN15_016709 [Acipenser sinensis]